MRIVHEVQGHMQQTAGGNGPYIVKVDEDQANSTGFRVELMAVPDPNYKEPWQEPNEAIYIEGDAAHVLQMLKTWVSMIEGTGDQYVREGLMVANWREKGLRPKKRN